MSEDGELMRRVGGGDEAALGALMERWELPVKGFLARMLQNSTEAEEIAHEAFVHVWQARARFREGAEFRPWLFSIAVNLARNRLRWWRRRPSVSLDEWGELAGEHNPDPSGLERAERAEAVRRAIRALPGDQRETLILSEYEGLSHSEIAAALGGTPKGVETRLYRARAALRKALKWYLS